jgi:hypothetical protein
MDVVFQQTLAREPVKASKNQRAALFFPQFQLAIFIA